jgi:hypothetical protein
MAQSKENVLVKGMSGTIGRLLTFRQRAGKTIVSKLLKPTTQPPTEKATTVRTKFKAGTIYAQAAAKDPVKGPLYKAAAQGDISAYNIALADAFNAPEVFGLNTKDYHGAVGNTIMVQAKDDFKVATVSVSVQDAAGNLVEQGNAVMQQNELDWLYTTTQGNPALTGSKILAVATDLPGNTGQLEITLP